MTSQPGAALPAEALPPQLGVDPRRGLGPFRFALLSVVLGVVAGLGAFGFRVLIGLVHNLFFLGRFSFAYDTLRHTPPGPWGLGVALVPALGAVLVVFLIKNFAPEAKGHGVPEVMDAVYYQRAVIRPVVAVVKALASATSIGSGGSVGREGPIIQIGAAFGSWSGRLLGVARWQRATLVAAGGGAGIAATFNTPIGGVLFAAEVLMHEISVRTLVPVALATATATYVGHFFFGDHPAFPIPPVVMPGVTSVAMLSIYVALGGVLAIAAAVFIRGLYAAEDVLEKVIPNRDYVRHVAGMLGVGLMAAALFRFTGHYYVEGVGYATIMDVLSGSVTGVGLLLLLCSLKLVATSLTLGSGASGGIFSPCLFLGTTIGAAYALALRTFFPAWHIDPAALALAGMAGMVAGATGAALTAIVMIFEMTLSYDVVLPMTLTVAVSYGLRRLLVSESVYTMKLARRGHHMPEALQANAYLVHHVSELPLAAVTVLPGSTPLEQLLAANEPSAPAHVVLFEDGRVEGVVLRDWARLHAAEVGGDRTLREAAALEAVRYITVPPDCTIFRLLAMVQAGHASVAVAVRSPDAGQSTPQVLGLITLANVAEAMAEGLEMFRD